jgi:hypothetical protein
MNTPTRRIAAAWLRRLATRVERGLCDDAIGRVDGPDNGGRTRVEIRVRGYASSEQVLAEVRS